MYQMISIKKLADLTPILGSIAKKVWKKVKADCGTRQVRPKIVIVVDKCRDVCANDYDCAARWALNLATGELGGSVHISTGEWALANNGQEKAITNIPVGTAVLTATWNDHYRTFTLEIAVNPENLPRQIES